MMESLLNKLCSRCLPKRTQPAITNKSEARDGRSSTIAALHTYMPHLCPAPFTIEQSTVVPFVLPESTDQVATPSDRVGTPITEMLFAPARYVKRPVSSLQAPAASVAALRPSAPQSPSTSAASTRLSSAYNNAATDCLERSHASTRIDEPEPLSRAVSECATVVDAPLQMTPARKLVILHLALHNADAYTRAASEWVQRPGGYMHICSTSDATLQDEDSMAGLAVHTLFKHPASAEPPQDVGPFCFPPRVRPNHPMVHCFSFTDSSGTRTFAVSMSFINMGGGGRPPSTLAPTCKGASCASSSWTSPPYGRPGTRSLTLRMTRCQMGRNFVSLRTHGLWCHLSPIPPKRSQLVVL